MSSTIRDYFRRFDHGVTESVYSRITMLDFQKNKAASQFLDYDKQSLFRKNKTVCGVRNIDNTCYLSVTIQILYNIQSLREKVFNVPQSTENQFIKELQALFALMLKGSLCYVDPTDLFAILKKSRPDVFVPGSQNDFHEVFTLVLDELEKGMPTEEEKRFIRKIFYGKNRINLLAKKGNQAQSQNIFSIINLSSKSHSFEKALAEYKKQKIEDYKDEEGESLSAEREIDFIETPALMTFFINRVEFKDKKLMKDSSEFEFAQKIFFNKKNLKTTVSKSLNDSEIQNQEITLKNWSEKILKTKEQLEMTLSYFEEDKEFENIDTPTINNPLGEKAKQNTKNFIKAEIIEIEKKVKQVEKEIDDLKKKRIKMAEENYSELYTLLAVMIHCGKTAESGHYKLCMFLNGEWIQFNDRRTEVISEKKIQQYKKKGQICCLFYKRNSLICQSDKNQVPATLKKLVQEKEKHIFDSIDNARILQSLYQQSETVNILFQFEAMSIKQNPCSYFFKPLTHLLKEKTPIQICKGYLLYEMIQKPKFVHNLKEKLITETQIAIPKISFNLPEEYISLCEGLQQFMDLEVSMNNHIEAFDLISFYMDVSLVNPIVREQFEILRQLITIKGIFYESMVVEYGLNQLHKQLSKNIDKIMASMNQDSTFVLVFVPIRHEILKRSKVQKQIKGVFKKSTVSRIDNYAEAFFERFKFEIQVRNKLFEVDETILNDFKKLYPRFMTSCE